MKRRIFTILSVFAIILNCCFLSYADDKKTNVEFEQIVREVNQYMETHPLDLDFENQTVVQKVPLSNGDIATITTRLTKRDEQNGRSTTTNLKAKVGTWDLDQNFDYGNAFSNAEGTISCVLDVEYVPETCDGTMPMFTCSSPSIYAEPPQGYRVADKDINLHVEIEKYRYSMDAYITYTAFADNINVNIYPEMIVSFAGNTQDTYNLIRVTLNCDL